MCSSQKITQIKQLIEEYANVQQGDSTLVDKLITICVTILIKFLIRAIKDRIK